MKRVVLVCAVFLLLAGLVAAPASAATKINFGLKAGLSFSNVSWSDDDGSEKMILKPTFGGFVLVPIGKGLFLQPEVNYLVTGEKWDFEGGSEAENFTYLHIPILLKYQFMEEGKVLPFIEAGPAIGFLLSADDDGEDVKSFFKSTDFGLEVGGGVSMPAGKMKVVLDARFYLGLTNAYNFVNDYSMKNRAFSVTAGLLF